jgi:type I restriction enzyme S subunit
MEKVKILKAVDIINDSVSEYEGVRPFLSTGDLNLSTITNLEFHTYLEKPSRANLNVSNGDIILARMQGTVKVKVIQKEDENIIVSTGFLVLRPKDNADNKYLFHLLRSSTFQNEKDKLCTGATQKAINNSNFEKLEIPLPPLATQQKIAAILDQATAIIANNRAIVAKYDALTQSLFLDMFGDPVKNEKGWEVKYLGEITELITDGKHGNCNDDSGSGYYFISAKDIRNNSINYADAREIPKVEFEEVDRRTNLQPGDLVMINTGATIGRMAIAKDIPETRKTTFQKSVAIIKVKKDIISSFYLQYVLELGIKTFANMGSGSAIKNLLLSEMRRFKIILPILELQNQFAERVQAIEAQKQQAQLELAKSESLFNSLLQGAFKGELS